MTKAKKVAIFATILSFICTLIADDANERETVAEMDKLIDEKVNHKIKVLRERKEGDES